MHVCVCVVNDHVEMASSNRATSFSLPCSSDPFRDDSFSTRRPDNTDRIIRPICLVEAKGKLGLEGKDRSPPRSGAETFKKKKKNSPTLVDYVSINAHLSAIHKIHGYSARMAATGSGGAEGGEQR